MHLKISGYYYYYYYDDDDDDDDDHTGIIHTVGPVGTHPQKLASCYQRCLEEMVKHELRSIVSWNLTSLCCCFSTRSMIICNLCHGLLVLLRSICTVSLSLCNFIPLSGRVILRSNKTPLISELVCFDSAC